MSHSCHHCHCSHTVSGTANRIFVIGVLLNIGFVVAEIFFGLTTHSLALLADAGHNASDVFGLLLAWGAQLLKQRPPTERYTYGFRRSSILAALSNALILLLVMGGIALEAIERLTHPSSVAVETTIAVATVGILVNGGTAFLFARESQDDLNVRGVFWHVTADALISLKVVLVGILIATTHWLWLDAVASLMIVGIVTYSTVQMFRESLNLALDAVPPSIELSEVRSFFMQLPGVIQVWDLHIWAISTTETALTVRLLMPGGHPGDAFLQQLQSELNRVFAIHRATIQIEIGDFNQTTTLFSTFPVSSYRSIP